jgi:NADH-quinone oxidoreductase subunit L
VIIAMHHEQDIRHMGGLRTKLPFTYWTMVVGTLALTGLFPFAGYFSKDAIIDAAYAGNNPAALYAYLMTLGAAGLTSFYSWRLIFKTFHGRPHDEGHFQAAHESPPTMLIPLFVLALGCVLAGYPFLGIFAGSGVENFFGESLAVGGSNTILEEAEHVSTWISVLPSVLMAAGFAVAWLFYIRRPDLPVELARQHEVLYRFLLNKWYFDELYDVAIVRPTLWIGRLFWKGGDGWLIDGFGPDGLSALVLDVTRNVVRLQTGYLYHYAFLMLIGVAAFMTWFTLHVYSGGGG